ncbi:hypothetical protein [Spiroplasma tabanidicola]|uniref:Uncharacterized protein n=1 Tax=Spiroplasma tabanidicola TaxID=324079 RepID=A0A6I6C9A0_9MOLU|nr:hypothetical protein [Spiroplasma tabanidicola]QGS52029.1 hypothetical protein STABA_v1c06680 [Spiroplasma tabanidicola]
MKEIKNLVIDDEDLKDFYDYKDIRGMKTYLYLADLLSFITQREAINYKEVRSIIIYDKRIKNILYRYFANIEDFLKALIFDHFIIINGKYIKNDVIDDFSVFEKFNIIKKNENKDGWSQILFSLMKNEIVDHNVLVDLHTLKDFRNKVMHYNFILVESLKNNEFNFDWLDYNLDLFLSYLPEKYHKSFVTKINNAKLGLQIQEEFVLNELTYDDTFLLQDLEFKNKKK